MVVVSDLLETTAEALDVLNKRVEKYEAALLALSRHVKCDCPQPGKVHGAWCPVDIVERALREE